MVLLSSYVGKDLVVVFMATWADNCLEISQNIARILENNSFPNVVFLSVSIDPTHDTSAVLTKFITDNNLQSFALNSTHWIFARDMRQQYTNYGVSAVPNSFLVNQSSRIVNQKLGLLSYDIIYQWLINISSNAYLSNQSNASNISTANFTISPFILVFILPLLLIKNRSKNG